MRTPPRIGRLRTLLGTAGIAGVMTILGGDLAALPLRALGTETMPIVVPSAMTGSPGVALPVLRAGTRENRRDVRVAILVPAEATADERLHGVGTIHLERLYGGEPRSQCIDVIDGRFEVDLPFADASFRVCDIDVGGDRWIPSQTAHREFRDGQVPPRITVRRASPFIVYARDAVTHVELRDVEIVGIANGRDFGVEVPSPEASHRLVSGRDSPIDLLTDRPGPRTWKCFVRAEGYAWTSMLADSRVAAVRVVELIPSGDLSIDLAGSAPENGIWVRARRLATGNLVFERSLRGAGSSLEIAGIAPGTLEVTAETGSRFRRPVVLAAARVEITAGSIAHAPLRIDGTRLPRVAPFSGIVELPSLGTTPNITLSFRRSGDLDGPTVFEWPLPQGPPNAPLRLPVRCDGLEPGIYRLWIPEFAHAETLVLPPAGLAEHRIAVAAPARVRVSWIDFQGNPVTDLPAIRFRSLTPTGSPLDEPRWVAVIQRDGTCDLTTVPGEIELRCEHRDFQPITRVFRVSDRSRDIQVVVERACGAFLRLRRAGRSIDWPAELHPRVTRVGSGGKASTIEVTDTKTLRVVVPEPGVYRFDFPERDGLPRIESIELSIPRGEWVRHAIELD